ncbi:hypothetical protein [Microbacterium oleivorans]|uniref:hypothetical protein n=1 Tax=Microbacterium oleivorans TaxID=273677 RepID=UPI002040CC68|nr:hypothetical protein [Microbacterium oleivorans]MCM3695946.1 hypothetical protein [Microbacterium oleivorans]
MSDLRVTVVPVALRADEDEQAKTPLSLSFFKLDSRWLTEAVSAAPNVIAAASRLLREAVPDELVAGGRQASDTFRLENAGVDYSSGSPNLLLTAALPIAATELRNQCWTELIPWGAAVGDGGQLPPLDPVRSAVAMYWREQLTKTTAALDFLPKYFPASQVRAVYESLWGGSQSESNFQRWLTTARDAGGAAICEEIADTSVREEAQAAFARNLTTAGMATGMTTASAVAGAWDPKFVGTSGKVSALAGLAVIPAAVVAGALVGSFVSWQRSRVTGRPPTWYRRTVTTRSELKALYAVRPAVPLPSSNFVS